MARLKSYSPKITRQRTRLGDWQLDIARNGFSGSIACALRASDRRAFYRSGAVAFRFKSRWNVNAAIYRIDNGNARSFRDDMPALIALGVPVDRGGMDNPTAGTVWITFAKLAEANSVAIEPRPGSRATVFHFRGLTSLHDIAVARGCSPESRFVDP